MIQVYTTATDSVFKSTGTIDAHVLHDTRDVQGKYMYVHVHCVTVVLVSMCRADNVSDRQHKVGPEIPTSL